MGDAGAVAVRDTSVAERVRALSQYGWEAKYAIKHEGGRNSRMDEVQAAILRTRLRRLDAINARRREITLRYRESLTDTPARLLGRDDQADVAHLAVLRVPGDHVRDRWREALAEHGIMTDVHYPIPDNRQRGIGDPQAHLPITEQAVAEILSLPCFPELAEREVDAVCNALSHLA
jgi:dTDP-4-amino-4,6-dideoxygalactose transaminase